MEFNSDYIRMQLAALGVEPDEIAARLLDAGAFGYRCAPCTCPLVEFFKRFDLNVSVRRGLVLDGPLLSHARLLLGMQRFASQDPCIVEFIRLFDEGKYPWLEHGWVES